jgi:hypothetical protein
MYAVTRRPPVTDKLDTMRDLVNRIAQTFPNADTVPSVIIPWGENEQSGIMVDTVDDDYRIGIYQDLSTGEPLAMVDDIPTATIVWNVLTCLTEDQPEGTDWTAWAAHWVEDIWADMAGEFNAHSPADPDPGVFGTHERSEMPRLVDELRSLGVEHRAMTVSIGPVVQVEAFDGTITITSHLLPERYEATLCKDDDIVWEYDGLTVEGVLILLFRNRPSESEPLATEHYDDFLRNQVDHVIRRMGLTWGDDEQRRHMVVYAAEQLRRALLD